VAFPHSVPRCISIADRILYKVSSRVKLKVMCRSGSASTSQSAEFFANTRYDNIYLMPRRFHVEFDS
jgi:hypothetical protein